MATVVNNPVAQAQAKNVIFASTLPNRGPKAYRLEIDEFLADNALTSLFLLALAETQKNSIRDAKTGEANW